MSRGQGKGSVKKRQGQGMKSVPGRLRKRSGEKLRGKNWAKEFYFFQCFSSPDFLTMFLTRAGKCAGWARERVSLQITEKGQ